MWGYRQVGIITGQGLGGADVFYFLESLSSENLDMRRLTSSLTTESKHHFHQLLVVQPWGSVSFIWKIGLLVISAQGGTRHWVQSQMDVSNAMFYFTGLPGLRGMIWHRPFARMRHSELQTILASPPSTCHSNLWAHNCSSLVRRVWVRPERGEKPGVFDQDIVIGIERGNRSNINSFSVSLSWLLIKSELL